MYEPVVFSYYGLMEMPVTEILERGIPAEQNVAQAYMRDLLGAGTEREVVKPELDDVTVERIAAVAPR